MTLHDMTRPETGTIEDPVEWVFPTSSQQRRIWFDEMLDPGTARQHIVLGLDVAGDFSPTAFASAFQRTVDRHEVLRTRYLLADHQPVQVVRSAWGAPAHLVDLTQIEESADLVSRLTGDWAEAPFDLSSQPPLRLLITRISPAHHQLCLVVHHIACDGWSLRLLVEEMRGHYESEIAGSPVRLPDLDLQYGDYAAWQQEMLQENAAAGEIAYWRQAIAGAPTHLQFSVAATPTGGHIVHRRSITFDGSDAATVRDLLSAEGLTWFMAVGAALGVVVGACTGQRDVLIGAPTAGRERPELRTLVGCFIDLLVLRVDLSDDPTVGDLFRRVRAVCLDAYAHSTVPFETLVQHAAADREPGRPPLFQVLLNAQPESVLPAQLGAASLGLSMQEHDLPPKYDLTVNAYESAEGFRIHLEFDSTWCHPTVADSLAESLRTMLRSFPRSREQRISNLRLLGPDSDARTLRWGTGADPHDGPTIVDMLASRARTDGGYITAVDDHLCWAQVWERAEAIAAALTAAGVRRGEIVAVVSRRRALLLPILVGVWRSRAAFLLVDPTFPPERVDLMLRDCRARFVVVDEKIGQDLPSTIGIIDASTIPTERQAGERPSESIRLPDTDDAAYCLYTSGSTGRPKGVVVTHRALANLVRSMSVRPGLVDTDTVVALTTVSFDIALLELFGAPTVGARLVLADDDTARDPRTLGALIDRERASVVQLTPTMLRLLWNTGWRPRPGLRIWCGGEALPRDLAVSVLEADAELWNMYGPTETTIWSACQRVDHQSGVALGNPVAGTVIQVCDEWLRPLPIGIVGEILIGGVGVAQGYHDRPALTAERFLPAAGGGRWYRTGDRGWWDDCGHLNYHGRSDQQVKIRGHRVELSEVEHHLNQVDEVLESVATINAGPLGPALTAYVVPRYPRAGTALPDLLRQTLLDRLPEYMVPTSWNVLEELPRTANGKTDRRALPPPDAWAADLLSPIDDGELPDIEKVVVAAFQAALGRPSVRLDDDFFVIGGHSLLAIEVMERMAGQGVDVALRDVLSERTPRGIAAAVRAAAATQRPSIRPTMPTAEWGLVEEDMRLEIPVVAAARPGPPPASQEARPATRFLLTGATGFFGHALLEQLLAAEGTESITCVVRARDDGSARQRGEDACAGWGAPGMGTDSRVRWMAGDIATQGFGLSVAQRRELSRQTDLTLHCGAEVSFMAPYPALRRPNVLGTLHALDLAAETADRRIVLISTLGVAMHDPAPAERPYSPLPEQSGYAASKSVSEALALRSAHKGLDVTILRPWTLAPHSSTGAIGRRDRFALLLRAMLRLGARPRHPEAIHILPVDRAARAAVTAALHAPGGERIVHLANPTLTSAEMIVGLLDQLGHRLEPVMTTGWASRVRASALPAEVKLIAELTSHEVPDRMAEVECTNARELGLLHELTVRPTADYLSRAIAFINRNHGRIR